MALLTVSQISTTGIVDPTLAVAAAAGDTFVNNGRTFLIVKKGNAGDATVTIDSLANCNQGHDHNIAVVVNNQEKWIGPFPMDRFNSSAGIVTATYSSESNITVGAVSL